MEEWAQQMVLECLSCAQQCEPRGLQRWMAPAFNFTEQGKMPPIKECVESDTAWRKRGQRTQHTEKLHGLSNEECAGVLWSLELCAFLSPQRHSFGYCNLRFVPTEEPSAVSAHLPFLLFPSNSQEASASTNITVTSSSSNMT